LKKLVSPFQKVAWVSWTATVLLSNMERQQITSILHLPQHLKPTIYQAQANTLGFHLLRILYLQEIWIIRKFAERSIESSVAVMHIRSCFSRIDLRDH
jgi:hypothetical protein